MAGKNAQKFIKFARFLNAIAGVVICGKELYDVYKSFKKNDIPKMETITKTRIVEDLDDNEEDDEDDDEFNDDDFDWDIPSGGINRIKGHLIKENSGQDAQFWN